MNDTMNKVKVFIAGKSYVLQTDEEERYVLNLARQVDKGIKDMMQGDSTMSMPDACILFAMDVLDEKEKSGASSDNLRDKIKDYIDEANRANARVDELQKQIEILENDKKNLQNELQLCSLQKTLGDK